MKRLILWLPLLVFLVFVIMVAARLSGGRDDTIRSELVGQPLPPFALPPAIEGRPGVGSPADGPRVINIFASWCVPCIAEAPRLLELQHRGLPIDAIAVRDRPEDIARFLARHGDPFRHIGADTDSRVQLALGSSGVPETFVVDAKGIIRHQHIGELREEHLPEIIAAYEAAK